MNKKKITEAGNSEQRATEKVKAVQYFSDEYLSYCSTLSVEQILVFLEEFRLLHAETTPPDKFTTQEN
ncbi:MAG: hypothetical protein PHC51_03925 [bacterium]|nr:hypothetical protein [bacterium]